MQKDRRRAFEVVDRFEQTLCEYTGARYAVAVDSCTNALFLSFLYRRHRMAGWYEGDRPWLILPKRTYCGVGQAAVNAGYVIRWDEMPWRGWYEVAPIRVIDAAKRLTSGMYGRLFAETLVCVSFQRGKILGVGRGGAILTDDEAAARWLRRARFDGRSEGDACEAPEVTTPGFHMYMDPPTAAAALWAMTYIAADNPDQVDEYPDLSEMEAFRC